MKKVYLTVALACASVFAVAQNDTNRDENGKNLHGPYETNRFFDNWFIGVAGGINLYHGEIDNKAAFGDRLAPALDISLGKWFTPSVGARLQYSGLQAKGLISYPSVFATSNRDGSYYKEKFNTMNLHADFLWNLSNSICGYNEKRVWNFIPYAGFGWARASENGATENEFAPSFGFLNTFRLGRRVDLTLEARQMLVNQRFDGVVDGSKWEGMTSVTLGLSFRLGKTTFKRVQKVDIDPYLTQIVRMEDDLSDAKRRNKQLEAENEALRNRKVESVQITSEKVVASPVALFFKIGKSTLDSKELTNLAFYVKNAIKADKDKVFVLIGSADKATGSKELNQRLSEQRVKYVHDLLVKEYGISEDRMEVKAIGDSDNRFSEPELNRVVIVE